MVHWAFFSKMDSVADAVVRRTRSSRLFLDQMTYPSGMCVCNTGVNLWTCPKLVTPRPSSSCGVCGFFCCKNPHTAHQLFFGSSCARVGDPLRPSICENDAKISVFFRLLWFGRFLKGFSTHWLTWANSSCFDLLKPCIFLRTSPGINAHWECRQSLFKPWSPTSFRARRRLCWKNGSKISDPNKQHQQPTHWWRSILRSLAYQALLALQQEIWVT